MVTMNVKILKAVGLMVAAGLILASAGYALGLLSYSTCISSSGVIASVNLAVYWDNTCTNSVTAIDWGTISPGGSKSVQVYVKNSGNIPITLSLSTESWNPSNAGNYITLTWDYISGTKIQPGSVQKITLTLVVSSNVQGITNFSFNIVIAGTESQ